MNDKPTPGVMYALTGKTGDKCIMSGNTWADSMVKPATYSKKLKTLTFFDSHNTSVTIYMADVLTAKAFLKTHKIIHNLNITN